MKGNKGKLNQCKVARNVRAPNRIKLIGLLAFWCSYSGLVAKGGRGEEELFVLPGRLVVSCLALPCGQRNDVRVWLWRWLWRWLSAFLLYQKEGRTDMLNEGCWQGSSLVQGGIVLLEVDQGG